MGTSFRGQWSHAPSLKPLSPIILQGTRGLTSAPRAHAATTSSSSGEKCALDKSPSSFLDLTALLLSLGWWQRERILSPSSRPVPTVGLLGLQLPADLSGKSKHGQVLAAPRMLPKAPRTQLGKEHFPGLLRGTVLQASRFQLRGDKERAGTRGPSRKDVRKGGCFMTSSEAPGPLPTAAPDSFQWLKGPLQRVLIQELM